MAKSIRSVSISWVFAGILLAFVFGKIYLHNACVRLLYARQRMHQQLAQLSQQKALLLADYARLTTYEYARCRAAQRGMVALSSRQLVSLPDTDNQRGRERE